MEFKNHNDSNVSLSALCPTNHYEAFPTYIFFKTMKVLDTFKRNASNTLFSTLSQTLTILLGEINACPTTLSEFHFQNVGLTLI